MTAAELALVVTAVLCVLAFAALIVTLVRVLDALRALRREVETLRAETGPLLAELRGSVEDARDDLERFDRLIGSAEAISDTVQATAGRVTRAALTAPVIKTVALATGGSHAARRLRRKESGR
ncbi:MAG TPA: hypothetical protein VG478_09815 [Acidimicrobiales bacterium]|nr:hypothetical protein [Acidimicrobiales bacterium]